MIETIHSVQNVRVSSRTVEPVAVVASTQSVVPEAAPGGGAYAQVHVDNLQNAVILEYRSHGSGEVIWQVPTPEQIAAFRQAEKVREEALHLEEKETPSIVKQDSATTVSSKTTNVPATHLPLDVNLSEANGTSTLSGNVSFQA